MKNLTISLIVAATAAMPAGANAAEGFFYSPGTGVAIGASVDGSRVFGCEGPSGAASQSAWLFDVAARETSSPFAPFDEQVPDTGGQVAWLNAAGTMAGTIRDHDWVAPEVTGEDYNPVYDYPLFSACLWTADGELVKLDHNRWADAADFVFQDGSVPKAGNGFYGCTVADDGSAVAGYLRAYTYLLPVRWKRNADGQYVSTMLPRETGEFFYLWVGASADCRRIILNTKQSGGQSYIWNDDKEPSVFTYREEGAVIEEPVLTALSPSGRYAIMECYRDGLDAHGVYDFQTGQVAWIAVPEGASSSRWFAANVVSDRADGFITDYEYRLHYFSTELGITIPLKDYVDAYGSDLEILSELPDKALARAMSADGRTICGNWLIGGTQTEGWVLRLPDTKPMLFALTDCEALFTPSLNLLVKWREPELPEGATVLRYAVSVDDGPETVAENPVRGADGKLRLEVPCTGGRHKATVYAVARDKDGAEWKSVPRTVEAEIASDTSLFFFEDLDDSIIDTEVMAYLYTHDTFTAPVPNTSDALSFRLDGGDFCNLTPFWYTCGFSRAEWHTYLESRWFDATGCDSDFYFTWQERNMPVNDATAVVASNRLLLECSVDGETWEVLHASDGEANAGTWQVQAVDLSDLRGRPFRLRFHAVGGGKQACEWRIDYYGVRPAEDVYDAPEGLMVTDRSEKGLVSLAWKNNRGEYEVSHNYNSPMTYNQSLGNLGDDLYVACDYGPSKLKAFKGKYITAVSTMLYEPSTVYQPEHTRVEAIVFDEQGNELSRGRLADDAPWFDDEAGVAILPIHHIDLDTPVPVEQGRTYRVAIKISDYEYDMCPIWYFSASDDYIAGVTDLYSDDGLQTWNSFSDWSRRNCETDEEFKLYGRCIFNIRPCITDEPAASAVPYEQSQWFYQVYRDGELLPHGIAYYTQQSVTDVVADGAVAAYTVRSFRRDGSMSRESDTLVYDSASLGTIAIDPATEPVLVPTAGGYELVGDFDSVAVYTVGGIKVGDSPVIDASRLPHGFYIVRATRGGRSASVKFGI